MLKSGTFRFMPTIVVVLALFLFLVSCGGGGGDDSSGGGALSSGSITLSVVYPPESTDASIPADGSSSVIITALVKDSGGNPVHHGTDVTFTTTLGRFINGNPSYTIQTLPPLGANGLPDPSAAPTGMVEVALIAGTQAGIAEVKVTSNGVSQSVEIQMTGGLASAISLKASSGSVMTDNSDSTTITATVLDANNAQLEGATVAFKASDGALSGASVVTDANGEAKVIFSCGNLDNSNRVSTITASIGKVNTQILIQVTGTTLNLQTDYNNLEIDAAARKFGVGNDKATLTITAADAGNNLIYNSQIFVSVDPVSTGDVYLSPTSGYTDSRGQLEVEVTGKTKGNVIVKVEGLGTTATQVYTVGVTGEVFTITSPQEDPYDLEKGASLTVVVRAPSQNHVIFATTCGAWDGGTSAVVTKPVVNKEVSAVLSSNDACAATVQVYDADNPSTTDSLKVNIYLPADAASRLDLQAGAYVVALSSGGVLNSVTLEATVRNDTFQIVPNVPVSFSIADSTGGGEYISPPLAYTEEGSGKAKATFTSGSISSGARGVTVNAAVVGSPAVSDSVNIVIGGTAGSVVIGRSTVIESINNDTSYRLPMTAQVVDSNGNPVAGARISLQLWPKYYQTGIWIPQATGNTDCLPEVTNSYPNEDDSYPGTQYYRNLILDSGTGWTEDKNGDGQLTPASSAAGSVPSEVVADSTGVASFYLIYPKSSAVWIVAELTGSTLVLGSETRSKTEFVLPFLVTDAKACLLPDSSYNNSEPSMNIVLSATPDKVLPDGGLSTSAIRATVTQLGESVPDGTLVSFAITAGTGGLGNSTSSEASAITMAGQASVTYFSGDIPGNVTIKAVLADGTSSTVTLTLTKGVGDPFSVTLTATPNELSADGGASQSAIRADVKDSQGYPVFDGTLISFAIVSGSGDLSQSSALTSAGIAGTTYSSGSMPGDVWIRALAENGVNQQVKIALVKTIGSMTLVANPDTIPADGTSWSTITATIRDTADKPVTKGTSVTFVTTLGTFANGETRYTVLTPDDTGAVTVSLIAGTTVGPALVTASASIGINKVTQSIEVTMTAP